MQVFVFVQTADVAWPEPAPHTPAVAPVQVDEPPIDRTDSREVIQALAALRSRFQELGVLERPTSRVMSVWIGSLAVGTAAVVLTWLADSRA